MAKEKAPEQEEIKDFLAYFQAKLKAPKGQFNNFGKYKYRSCEDIVEAIKPIVNPHGFSLQMSDSIVFVEGRFYVQAAVTLTNGKITYTAIAYAREETTKKGMDESQITGASSSYARKYALNGLFAIDDSKDSDATNEHGNAPEPKRDTQPEVSPRTLQPKPEQQPIIPPTPEKPYLSQKQFDTACRRIADGDAEVYQKTVDAFRIKKEFRTILDEEHAKWEKFYKEKPGESLPQAQVPTIII